MSAQIPLIQTKTELRNLAQALRQEVIIAVDTEFIRETTYRPQLALIQVASRARTWLVDPLAFSREEMAELLSVFTDPNILKVLHSSYADQECFFLGYRTLLTPTFDTYEAASLLGYGESVSLQELLQRVLHVKIPKFLTRTNWLKRPLPEEMKSYAASDVDHLVALGEKMQSSLREAGREAWALRLSAYYEDPDLYQKHDEDILQRLGQSGKLHAKSFGILKNLVEWREARAQELDIPRKRIADDETLIHLANAQPKDLTELGRFRGISPSEVRKQGDALLALLHCERAKQIPLPPRCNPVRPNADQAGIADFLATFLKLLCKKYRIAVRLTLNQKNLQKIVCANFPNPAAWVEAGLCSEEVAELIGAELQAALQGQCGLGVVGGKLKILPND